MSHFTVMVIGDNVDEQMARIRAGHRQDGRSQERIRKRHDYDGQISVWQDPKQVHKEGH
jgi:hypothetical protein